MIANSIFVVYYLWIDPRPKSGPLDLGFVVLEWVRKAVRLGKN